MSLELGDAERIAKAVLYEGYLLYPYRTSSVKNRKRWTFGGVYPRAYSEAQAGHDSWTMQTECLVAGNAATQLEIKVRFLHLLTREVGELPAPLAELPTGAEPAFRPVETLRAGEQVLHAGQEAVERDVSGLAASLGELSRARRHAPHALDFSYPGRRTLVGVRAPSGEIVGVSIHSQAAIVGRVEAHAETAGDGLFKVIVRILNFTEAAVPEAREEILPVTFVSTHTLLGVQDGEFVSLIDPPEAYRAAVQTCHNTNTWPVLVGEEGQRDLLLSSPIILYDYPQIAPESAGDLFDGTEIDEILTLRIMTLSDDEKQEIRQGDMRARELLERTESLPPELLQRMHGALRTLRPAARVESVEHNP